MQKELNEIERKVEIAKANKWVKCCKLSSDVKAQKTFRTWHLYFSGSCIQIFKRDVKN